jgi:hypothetical protein
MFVCVSFPVCSKAWFLNRTAELNPFGSNYFAWFDAGYCREDRCRYPTIVDNARVIDVFEGFDDEHTTHVSATGVVEPGFETTKQQFPTTPPGADVLQERCRVVPGDDQAEVRCTFPRATHPHPSLAPVRSRRHKILFEQVGNVRAELQHEFRCPRALRSLVEPSPTDPPTTIGIYMAGTYIMGSGPAARWYADAYNRTLFGFSKNGWYYGSDQYIASFIASVYPNSFLTLDTSQNHACGSTWFFLPQYLQPHWNRACRADQYMPVRVKPLVDHCDVRYPNEDMHQANYEEGDSPI